MENLEVKNKEYKSMLESQVCEVTFTKVNGDERIMRCTLHKDLIPQATKTDSLSTKKVREINLEVIPVWDMKAEGWRSFRVDSVKDIVKSNFVYL
jgi:hypothetical protein